MRRWLGFILVAQVALAQPNPGTPGPLGARAQHTEHYQRLAAQAPDYNPAVLRAIDTLQARYPDGGGYFTGVRAEPTESPIGYPLQLWGQALLNPPRPTSYCSGSSYAVFIEALNTIRPVGTLSPERLEALRMQESDGSRREDGVKAWGWWNADGLGTQYAMVQYLRMGEEVHPLLARPGDFVNLLWTNGLGHSVVFLGWGRDPAGELEVRFFSSQASTHGLGDQTAPARRIRALKFVRLRYPEKIFVFDTQAQVDPRVDPDEIGF